MTQMRKEEKFVPRYISSELAALGYNNEGHGELIGYIAEPAKHEKTCRYRISTGGNPDKNSHESCSCRIGLWRDTTPAQKVVNEMRKTAKRNPRKAKPSTRKTKKKIP